MVGVANGGMGGQRPKNVVVQLGRAADKNKKPNVILKPMPAKAIVFFMFAFLSGISSNKNHTLPRAGDRPVWPIFFFLGRASNPYLIHPSYNNRTTSPAPQSPNLDVPKFGSKVFVK